MGDEEPRLRTFNGFLPRLRHSAAPSQPREGALDHPAARDHLETPVGVRAFDDLQRPAPDLFQAPPQLGSGIPAIGEDMAQQRVGGRDRFQQARRAVTILNIGTVNGKADQEPDGIGDDVTLAPLYPLAGVIASPLRFRWFSRSPSVRVVAAGLAK